MKNHPIFVARNVPTSFAIKFVESCKGELPTFSIDPDGAFGTLKCFLHTDNKLGKEYWREYCYAQDKFPTLLSLIETFPERSLVRVGDLLEGAIGVVRNYRRAEDGKGWELAIIADDGSFDEWFSTTECYWLSR